MLPPDLQPEAVQTWVSSRRKFIALPGQLSAVINRHDLDRAQEVAERYFPREFRARFIDATSIGGSREAYRQDQERQRAEREQLEARTDPPNDEIRSMVIGVTFMVVILGGVALLFWLASYLGGKKEEGGTSGNYGTADYAPIVQDMNGSLFKGVYLGASAHTRYPNHFFSPILSSPESHTLIVAPSRTGKGTSVILPTLLLYKSSLITIDPKGENTAITARYRRDQLGHTVHIVNPWGMHEQLYRQYGFGHAALNPLDVLDPKDRNVVGIANSLAVTICHQSATNDSFWQDSAAAMLAGILLWVTDAPGETKTLARVADLVSGGENADDLRQSLFPRMVASSSFRGAMRKLVGRFVKMDDKTYSNVIAQLSKSLQFMADDQVATATDHSSFNLAELANGRTTLYIVIPDDQMQPQAIWLKLMVNAVTQTFKRHRPAASGVRGMFLIDEFPVLGRVDSIVTDIAVVGGAGLDVTLIVQGLDQLHSIYGTSANTIIGNCGYKWFCNVKDLQTAEYVSKALGQMTVETVSQTISAADGKASRTMGETGRALLFADEIMSMGKGVAFAFQPRGRPHYLKPVDYRILAPYLAGRATIASDPPNIPNVEAVDPNPFHTQSGGAAPNGKMDRAEALATFGLQEGATAADVNAAYKSLMGKLHPDRGGTTYLAQKLNEARDLLLGKKK
jgi:type IV secretion system protein VirD4